MSTTTNGWAVQDSTSPVLFTWTVPGTRLRIRLRNGSVGFLLVYFLLFFHERVESLTAGHPADDWGYAYRPKRGQTTGWSEHAGGAAVDANATQHPQGTRPEDNFTATQIRRIRRRLRLVNAIRGTVLIWGGDWRNVPDPMHVEVTGGMQRVERVAKVLAKTPRGRRVLKANPGQRQVIWS